MKDPLVKLRLSVARRIIDSMPGWSRLPHGLALRRALDAAEALAARKKARPLKQKHVKPDPKDGKAKKARADEEHKERMRLIREALAKRSNVLLGGYGCERCGTRAMEDPHHLFGRGKGRPQESERTCIGVCRRCHRLMQHPTTPEVAAENWEWAARHLQGLGFGEEATMCWARSSKCRYRAAVTQAGKELHGG